MGSHRITKCQDQGECVLLKDIKTYKNKQTKQPKNKKMGMGWKREEAKTVAAFPTHHLAPAQE